MVAFSKLNKPIPVRLSHKGMSIGFKYTGQPRSCPGCSSFEHLVSECPYRKAKSTETQNRSQNRREQAMETSVNAQSKEQMQIKVSELSPPAAQASQAKSQTTRKLQATHTHKNDPLTIFQKDMENKFLWMGLESSKKISEPGNIMTSYKWPQSTLSSKETTLMIRPKKLKQLFAK